MMKRSASSTTAFIFAAFLLLTLLVAAAPIQAFVVIPRTPGGPSRRNVAVFAAGKNEGNKNDGDKDEKKPFLITKEQKEHLDKFGPNPEIVGEIFFDKLTAAPDVITNALPGKWKDLVVNLKDTRKEDQKIKAERLERQKARDEERKARRKAEKSATEQDEEGGRDDVEVACCELTP